MFSSIKASLDRSSFIVIFFGLLLEDELKAPHLLSQNKVYKNAMIKGAPTIKYLISIQVTLINKI